MRIPYSFLALTLVVSATANAEVKELDGEEMVDSYVQGISIGQVAVDKKFNSDDQAMRDTTTQEQNALGDVTPQVAVTNADALNKEPSLDKLVSDIPDQQTRDLVEDAITQTSLSTRLDINVDRIAAERGIPVPTPSGAQDFSVLRGTILELLPSATGYQFEFMKDRF